MEELSRLRIAITQIARALNAAGTDKGLTPTQASVLGLITNRGPLGLSELAEYEGINPTMLSRVIGTLTRLDLIDRHPDPSDLRSVHVETTPSGRDLHLQIKAGRTATLARSMDQLPPDVARRLVGVIADLEALATALRQRDMRAAIAHER